MLICSRSPWRRAARTAARDEQDEEDDEEDLGDAGRAGGDAGEAERAGDERDDREDDGPLEHGDLLLGTRRECGPADVGDDSSDRVGARIGTPRECL
jgi:hypothetical protein